MCAMGVRVYACGQRRSEKLSGKISVISKSHCSSTAGSKITSQALLEAVLPPCPYSRADLQRVRDSPLSKIVSREERVMRSLFNKFHDRPWVHPCNVTSCVRISAMRSRALFRPTPAPCTVHSFVPNLKPCITSHALPHPHAHGTTGDWWLQC